MFGRIITLGIAGLLLSAACTASPSTPTSTPVHACAGFGVPLMRIHIASDGSSTGDVLDSNAGNALVATYKLVWPAGYATRRDGSAPEIVNATGEVAASDGSTLVNVQVCGKAGQVLTLSEPITPASPSS